MKKIKLLKGEYALVDDKDFDFISKSVKRWHFNGHYVVGGWPLVSMHRLVIGAKKGQIVDHKNHNTLDNRRENLRFCTASQNQFNSRPTRGVPKGFEWDVSRKAWVVRTTVNGKRIYVGYFKKLEDAVEAYKKASLFYHKEFSIYA